MVETVETTKCKRCGLGRGTVLDNAGTLVVKIHLRSGLCYPGRVSSGPYVDDTKLIDRNKGRCDNTFIRWLQNRDGPTRDGMSWGEFWNNVEAELIMVDKFLEENPV